MAGDGISGFVLHTRDVYHAEAVTQGFLLEVAEPCIGDFLKGLVTKYFEWGLVVHGDDQLLQPRTKNRALSRASVMARASPSTGV